MRPGKLNTDQIVISFIVRYTYLQKDLHKLRQVGE